MSKPSKRPTREQRKRLSSTLAEHTKQGRALKPPFNTLPMTPINWSKDLWPDMIWPCFTLFHLGQMRGLQLCAASLDVVDELALPLVEHIDEKDRPLFDGRLTSFEKVPVAARQPILDRLEERGLYGQAFPESFAHLLGLYPAAPGRWLIDPWLRRGTSFDWEKGLAAVAPVREQSEHGQSQIATDAKAITLARYFKAGKIRFPGKVPESFELLPRYPDGLSEEELKTARPIIRVTFGGIMGIDLSHDTSTASASWAQEFWRSNWKRFPCDLGPTAGDPDAEGESLEESERELGALLNSQFDDLIGVARSVDPDLYNPDRYEVLTGIVRRSLRLASSLVGTPLLWSVEFGMPILRSVIESLIVLRWLVLKDDPLMYARFKDYGRGKLKLFKLHLEEHIDSLPDDQSDDLREYAEYVRQEVNQDIGEEFQDISLESSFSGVSAHKMAEEVGMQKEYQLHFAPASGVSHGEWTTLDRYALQRCRNPLHGGHRVPRSDDSTIVFSGFPEVVLGMTGDLVAAYQSAFKDAGK